MNNFQVQEVYMKKLLIFIFTLLSFSTFASTDPLEAYTMMQNNRAVIFDVREAEEVSLGMIKGALWFALSQIQSDSNWRESFIQESQGKEIYLYCRTGKRSEKFKKILKENGIEAENIGAFNQLKDILPVERPFRDDISRREVL